MIGPYRRNPYLKIAREFCLPYHVALLSGDYYTDSPHTVADQRKAIDTAFWLLNKADKFHAFKDAIATAVYWHEAQKAGIVDLDGNTIEVPA